MRVEEVFQVLDFRVIHGIFLFIHASHFKEERISGIRAVLKLASSLCVSCFS